MEPEAIIALASFAVFLFIQTLAFGYHAGLTSGKIAKLAEDAKTNHEDINAMDKKFVTNGKCKGINNSWRVEVTSLIEQRDFFNDQNNKDHSTLILQGAEMVEAMEKVKECLHHIQLKQDCQ